MQKGPFIAVIASVLLFLALYFGFSNVAPANQRLQQTRTATATVTDAESLIHAATDALTPDQKEALRQLSGSITDSIALYKQLSGWWVSKGQPESAGIYAVKVAEIENTAEAWSIAGATLHSGINESKISETARKYCAEQAKAAFEKAISLEPDEAMHRINLALVYADAPSDNPMQAVQMLRDLEAKYPTNPSVYNALARLAIKTGQWDRALQRLLKALELDPGNANTICLLAVAYDGAGDAAKASEWETKCRSKTETK